MNIYRSRCQDCICLVEGDNGEWVCDELNQEVEQVKDCPEGLELKKVASTSLTERRAAHESDSGRHRRIGP